MRKVQIIAIISVLLFSLAVGAEDKQALEVTKKIGPLPRDLEIQLALSALPPHLRDNATVYVLNPDKGFEVARKGTNGFHTFVARTGDPVSPDQRLVVFAPIHRSPLATHKIQIARRRDRPPFEHADETYRVEIGGRLRAGQFEKRGEQVEA